MKGRSDSDARGTKEYKTLLSVPMAIAPVPYLRAALQRTAALLSKVVPVNSVRLLPTKHHLVTQKMRPLSVLVISSLILAISIYVPAQQLQIKRNQLLVLHLGVPTGEIVQFNGAPAYRFLFQENPFIEVQFIYPLPARKMHQGRMTFACEEVGVYTDGSTQQVWTIGKRCKLR